MITLTATYTMIANDLNNFNNKKLNRGYRSTELFPSFCALPKFNTCSTVAQHTPK